MKYIFGIAILVLLSIFAYSVNLQNPELITLKYYFGVEWSIKVATLLLCTFLIGLFVGAFVVSLSLLGQKFRTSLVSRKLKKVEKEVESLRAAPAKESTASANKSSTEVAQA